jgi:magnesium chelatase subunit D
LQTAFDMALMSGKKGLLPSVILLTDGRGNIALDGTADRTKAELDAKRVAKGFAARGVDTLILDTGRRPEASLKAVAQILNGHYVALPRANAQNVSKTVSTALEL